MKRAIETFVKVLIYVSFFVPLIVIPSSFIFPFIVPKILLFRSLVTLMLAGYILLLVINWQEYRPRLTILNLVLAAFLASFALSTFIGVDWYHSFWDNHERMLGLFTVSHYIAYYFICSSVFKNWKEWRLALRIFLIAGALMAIVGLFQVISPDLLLNRGSDRVSSTLGNPIYVGGYGLFLSFVAFLLVIREKSNFWRYLEIVLGVMAILAMFFSGTRGAMLGLIAGIGVVLLGYIIVLKQYLKTRLALGVILIVGFISLLTLYNFRQTNFVKNIPAVGRAINTSLTDVKKSARWVAWEISVVSWKARPVFGWGPNNYFYAFNQYYNPKSLEFGYGETWFDNAHNIIMNTLTVQGLIGLIVYLSIFVFGVISVWKSYRFDQLNMQVTVVGGAFLVAHLVQNVTVFENPTSYLYFMVWLALLNRLANSKVILPKSETEAKIKSTAKPDRQIGYGSLITATALALLFVFIFNIQPARANIKTLNSLKVLSGNPMLAFSEMKDALAFSSPHIDDIRADIGRTVLQVLPGVSKTLGQQRSEEILDIAYQALEENLTLHPLDIRNQMTLSQLAQMKGMLSNKAEYFVASERYLEDALAKSPKRQQVIYALAYVKVQLGKFDETVKLYTQAINDNPKIGESYWRLAYTYKMFGKMAEANKVLGLAAKNKVEFTEEEKGIVAEKILGGVTTTNKIATTTK